MEFEKNYFNGVYKDYLRQNPDKKLNFYLREINKYKKSGKLLDVGCATGLFIEKAEKFFDIYGVDVSKYAIDIAKKKKLKVSVLSSDKLDFKNNFFDAITSFDVLEHVESLDNMLSEIRRVLKKDGVFVFVVPIWEGISGFISQLVDRDPTHIHKKNKKFWFKKMENHKFNVADWIGIFRILFVKYFHFQTIALKNYSPIILVICKRK